MSLLPKFVSHLSNAERQKLKLLPLRGKPGELMALMLKHPADSIADTETLRIQLGISNSFFDKICSELLIKCYETIAPNGGTQLLRELSSRPGLITHFYKELQKQLKQQKNQPVSEQADFYKDCIQIILTNLSIVNIDEAVLAEVGEAYVKCFKGDEKKWAICYVNCKLIYSKINKLFAKGIVVDFETEIEKEIEEKTAMPKNYDAELIYECNWLRLYLKFAVEKYDYSIDIAKQTLQLLGKYNDKQTAVNTLRLKLKIGEIYYFLSRFEDSFAALNEIFSTVPIREIPENGYYRTKFFQVALITGQLTTATEMMRIDLQKPGYSLKANYAIRDIISFIKYYLIVGEYNTAHELILLGYEKNPKAKLIQYEIELRNLEVAYFYLTSQFDMAITLCNRNIKFLRTRDTTIKNSNYPFFYLLTKAIYEQRLHGKSFSKRLRIAYDRYNRGSFGVYGKLLQLMISHR